MQNRKAFVCLGCGFSKTLPDWQKVPYDNCPKCGSKVLTKCPFCGFPLSVKGQKYCGLSSCEYRDVPFPELLQMLRDRQIVPNNEDALEEVLRVLELGKEYEEFVREKWKREKPPSLWDILTGQDE